MIHLERLFVIDRLHIVGWLDGGPTIFSPFSSSFLIKHGLRALLPTLRDIMPQASSERVESRRRTKRSRWKPASLSMLGLNSSMNDFTSFLL